MVVAYFVCVCVWGGGDLSSIEGEFLSFLRGGVNPSDVGTLGPHRLQK